MVLGQGFAYFKTAVKVSDTKYMLTIAGNLHLGFLLEVGKILSGPRES
jgi:hypothetical protein